MVLSPVLIVIFWVPSNVTPAPIASPSIAILLGVFNLVAVSALPKITP